MSQSTVTFATTELVPATVKTITIRLNLEREVVRAENLRLNGVVPEVSSK